MLTINFFFFSAPACRLAGQPCVEKRQRARADALRVRQPKPRQFVSSGQLQPASNHATNEARADSVGTSLEKDGGEWLNHRLLISRLFANY